MIDLTHLEEIQQEIENQITLQAKKEFDLALQGHNSIKPLLAKRDEYLESNHENGEFKKFWTRAFENYEVTDDLFPFINNKLDISWLKSFKVEYKEGYACLVRIELFTNKYVKNKHLEKKLIINDCEVETTKVDWIDTSRCGLFQFFDSEDSEFEVFDFLYEVYRNAIYYYLLEDM